MAAAMAEVMDSAAVAVDLAAAAMDSTAEAVGPTAEVIDIMAEATDPMEEAMDIIAGAMDTAETTGIMATMEDTVDTTGIAATMDITVTGGRGSMALVGVIRGTGIRTMDIPITAPTTIRPMATRMAATTAAATTAALTTEMTMPPVPKWPSCNADFRGLAITQVLSMESWVLPRDEQFAPTHATVGIEKGHSHCNPECLTMVAET